MEIIKLFIQKNKIKIMMIFIVIFALLAIGSIVESCSYKKHQERVLERTVQATKSAKDAEWNLKLAKQESITSKKHTELSEKHKKSYDSIISLLEKRKRPLPLKLKPSDQQIFWDTVNHLIKEVRWEN